jgi:CubicO group peptidase (beta-lactamase class C family)
MSGINPDHLMRAPLLALFVLPALAFAENPTIAGIDRAMKSAIEAKEVPGAVTLVMTKTGVRHLESHGLADVASNRAMKDDAIFAIFSMTKPVTGVALLMLQDDGKLNVNDPVAKYIPAFADLKTPSGKPANLTIKQVMTHTSGLGEASGDAARSARTLADLVPLFLAAPMQYEPGEKWKYTQSGINVGARIVEVASGKSFPEFLAERLFGPLGMKDTTHTPSEAQRARIVTPYAKNRETGALEAGRITAPAPGERPPTGNSGLYSTASDYARFCQMLLNEGQLEGRRYLSPGAIKLLGGVQTGDLPTGFFQTDAYGQQGKKYGWGIGTCILKEAHDGVAAVLSPGTYGHGGAWGTQAWIDPVKGVAYLMMVQRSNFPNADASTVRRDFQNAAADGLKTMRVGI